MKLNELRDTSYEIAKSKGWHDPEFDTATVDDRIALVISELAEALEEHRKGKPARNIEYVKNGVASEVLQPDDPDHVQSFAYAAPGILIERGHKPEGVIIELADVLIRIGDFAGKHEIDLGTDELAPLVVPAELGNSTTFGAWFCDITACLCHVPLQGEVYLRPALNRICHMVHWLGISGEEFVRAIEIKHAYNRTRPFRHGGKKL
jgi:NTP pyrophosphatase (non-canonical NTP hydrolase)